MFNVWVAGNRYECPVSRPLLYELCRTQDPQLDRIDAFIALKEKVRLMVEQLVREGCLPLRETLERRYLLH